MRIVLGIISHVDAAKVNTHRDQNNLEASKGQHSPGNQERPGLFLHMCVCVCAYVSVCM